MRAQQLRIPVPLGLGCSCPDGREAQWFLWVESGKEGGCDPAQGRFLPGRGTHSGEVQGVQKQKRGVRRDPLDRATTLPGMQHEALVGLSLGNPQNHPVRTEYAFGYQLPGSTKPQSQPH